MVGKRKPDSGISAEFDDVGLPADRGRSAEFDGGVLPGITGQQATPPPPAQAPNTTTSMSRQQASKTASQESLPRKKVTLYLDDPQQVDLIDDLLSALKKAGLPRDNSMLVRALLNLAGVALKDPEKLEALAKACRQTLPANR